MPAPADAAPLHLVSFVVAGEEYGVDILRVQEVIRPVPVTRVPHAPPAVDGVVNLRGRVVPVVDARRRFGLPARPPSEDGLVVVVDVGGRAVGLVMDAVREVVRVARSAVEPAPALGDDDDGRPDYVAGVAKLADRLVVLLDVERLLSGAVLDGGGRRA